MKQVKTEKISYDIKWEAIDGTQFTNEEECRKYESSARMVLWKRFNDCVIHTDTEYDLLNVGSDECTVYAVKMPTTRERDCVAQLWALDNSWAINKEDSSYRDEAFSYIDQAYKQEDVLLVGENCDGEIYIIGTRQTIIERLVNLDEKGEPNA